MRENINFHTCIYKDHKIWFVSTKGYFMNVDTDTLAASIVCANGNKFFNQVIDPMLEINDNFYWVEQNGQRLLQYDIKSNYCCAYDIPELKMVDWVCNSMVTKWKKQIFIFPKYTDKIIIFNTETKKFIEYNNVYRKYGIDNLNEAFVMHASVRKELVILFLADMQTVLFFSMSSNTVIKKEKMPCGREIVSSFWKDENLFIHEKEGDVYILNGNLEEIKKLEITAVIGKSYVKMVPTNKKIFMLPSLETDIVEYDLNNGSVKIMDNPEDLIYRDIRWGKYLGDCEDGNLLWMANRMSNYFLCIDKEEEYVRWRKLEPLCIDEEAKYYSFVGTKFFMEDRLELFIKLGTAPRCTDNNGNAGKSIWKRMNE